MGEPAIGLGRVLALDDDPGAVRDALRTVIDPELGVDIVDLGLVYDVAVDGGRATITMTTTTPACPIGGYLEDQVRWAVLRLPGIIDVDVRVVHDPPWSPTRMAESARRMLGWMG